MSETAGAGAKCCRGLGRALAWVLGVAAVTAVGVVSWVMADWRAFRDRPIDGLPMPADIVVQPGSGITDLARVLTRRGILSQPYYLIWLARWEGKATHIQAGEYELPVGLTPRALLDRLVQGKVKQYSLTLIEGWRYAEVMAALQRAPALEHRLGGLSSAQVMAALGEPEQHPEGRFFPDTYRYQRGMTDRSILRRAYHRMAQRLSAEWAGRQDNLPYGSPYEALIMASIIEKETGLASERSAIAGVFVRRLGLGMRLQSDPTVIYGLGTNFDGNLRRADLRADAPYNTYVKTGLPPTPIAMPGGGSLRAALHPAPGDALYFVARGDGSHEFSATLQQHNLAVRRYQLRSRSPARHGDAVAVDGAVR